MWDLIVEVHGDDAEVSAVSARGLALLQTIVPICQLGDTLHILQDAQDFLHAARGLEVAMNNNGELQKISGAPLH